jgi:predicted secreted protein
MQRIRQSAAAAVAFLLVSGAQAQPVPEPRQVVQLSASAQREAVQDWLTAVLVVRHQASDAGTVQNQLKVSLEQALAQARAGAQAGQVDVSSGGFTVQPRYGRESQIVGWQGSAELVLQGRDVARVAVLAGRIPGMVISQMSFSLSREASRRLEDEVRQEAIARFRSSATSVAKDFGFAGYELREVSVGSNDMPMSQPRFRVAAMADMAAASAAPVPVEPGRSVVQVTVSGSVQLK